MTGHAISGLGWCKHSLVASLLAYSPPACTAGGCELAHLRVATRNLRAIRFYERNGYVGTAQQPWMSTEPWQSFWPPELALDEALRTTNGLTAAELAATSMRGRAFKKFLGFDVGPVPKLISYARPAPDLLRT